MTPSKPASAKSRKPSELKPAKILLVRHASTPTTNKILPGRKAGLYLSKKGVREAELAAEYIHSLNPAPAAVYASPMERAQQTASIIAKALGKKTKRLAGLNECDFGKWTGRRISSLRKLTAWEQVQNSPSKFRFPEGESFLEMQSRIVNTVNELYKRHRGETIVAVSHADPIKAALNHYLGAPLDFFQKIHIEPAGISSIALSERITMVLAVNITNIQEQNNG